MKTAIKTLIAGALTVVVLMSPAFATFAQETKKAAVETNTPTFNMIKIKGNIRLHIGQSSYENIWIETGLANDHVSVERVGPKLLISSDETTPADIYVTLKDLKRIDASGQTMVMTSGMLNVTTLQIFLEDDAMAHVKVNATDLYTIIKGNSHLKLTGTSDQHVSVKSKGAKLNTRKFAALKTMNSESLFASVDLDVQLEESLHLNTIVVNHIK